MNDGFLPDNDEVEYATSVVAAFNTAQAKGEGTTICQGKLVDKPIAGQAQAVLDLHHKFTTKDHKSKS